MSIPAPDYEAAWKTYPDVPCGADEEEAFNAAIDAAVAPLVAYAEQLERERDEALDVHPYAIPGRRYAELQERAEKAERERDEHLAAVRLLERGEHGLLSDTVSLCEECQADLFPDPAPPEGVMDRWWLCGPCANERYERARKAEARVAELEAALRKARDLLLAIDSGSFPRKWTLGVREVCEALADTASRPVRLNAEMRCPSCGENIRYNADEADTATKEPTT